MGARRSLLLGGFPFLGLAQQIAHNRAHPLRKCRKPDTQIVADCLPVVATTEDGDEAADGYRKSAKRSLGETESALANLTMFSNATFRSPRSTPPT
jgi:hypothetical protein